VVALARQPEIAGVADAHLRRGRNGIDGACRLAPRLDLDEDGEIAFSWR
jgi:hypothetical protein